MVKLGVLRQFLAAFTSLTFGSSCSWSATSFLVFTSNETTPFNVALTIEEASLVVSILLFGGIFGCILYTCIIDRFGRITLLISISATQLVSWVIILFATNVYHLYFARFIAGLVAAGIVVVVPVFTLEIADVSWRGALGTIMIVFTNAGMVIGFIFVNYLDYYGQIKANIMFPVLFLIAIQYFPETPEYLQKQNQKNSKTFEAEEESRNFYRGIEKGPSAVKVHEMHKLIEEGKTFEKIETESLSLSDFCTPAAKKATAIALFLCALNQLCGTMVMMNYTNKIFQDARSSLNLNNASIVVAFVQFFANFLAMILVDLHGRKVLMAISTIGCMIGHLCMGLYDVYKVELVDHTWITIFAFSTVILFSSIGIQPLTFVIMQEILPKKIKNVVSFLGLEIFFILAFILCAFYPMMTAAFGTANCFFVFAACCAVGAVFLIVVPETKGRSYEEIMKAL